MIHATVNNEDRLGMGVLVVDDHDLVRLGLKTLLDSYARTLPCALVWFEAASLARAMDTYAQQRAHVHLVLLDLHLPDAHGLLGLQTFLRRFPEAPVAVISGNSDPYTQRQALNLGAQAYLSKNGHMQEVLDFVCQLSAHRAIDKGIAPSPTQVPGDERGPNRTIRSSSGMVVQLSARQSQVLDALRSGLSNREIAERVCLSEGTVKNHISQLLLSFGVRSRSQLLTLLR